ncbi:MAG: choice-of-anchor Q domain-containing protein [Parcubacteria group bacterium]
MKNFSKIFFLAVLFFGVFALAKSSQAAAIYVDNTTTSCSMPSDTDYDPATDTCGSGAYTVYDAIQGAADVVNAGDTVIVKDGTYGSEGKQFPLNIKISGNPNTWITFKAEHKWKAVLNGDGTAHSYINFEAPVSYIRIENFEITNCHDSGFWAQANFIDNSKPSHDIVIKGNHIHHIGNYETTSDYGITGIYLGSLNHHYIIDGNLWHDIGRTGPDNIWYNKDHSLYFSDWPPGACHHVTVTNNITYRNSGGAMETSCTDSIYSNNVFAWPNSNSRGGPQLLDFGNPTNSIIQNNIFYQPGQNGSGQAAFYVYAPTNNVTVRNNIVYDGTMWFAGEDPKFIMNNNYCQANCDYPEADPKFIGVSNDGNWANDNWALQPDSLAIERGVSDGAPAYDFDGNLRTGIPDIGAYEYVSGGDITPPSAPTGLAVQ